jgi:hypothetical protein
VLSSVAHVALVVREHIRARSSSSLYFFDYDNHVFELDTATLEEELKTEA